jgi:hypothetical protein
LGALDREGLVPGGYGWRASTSQAEGINRGGG